MYNEKMLYFRAYRCEKLTRFNVYKMTSVKTTQTLKNENFTPCILKKEETNDLNSNWNDINSNEFNL